MIQKKKNSVLLNIGKRPNHKKLKHIGERKGGEIQMIFIYSWFQAVEHGKETKKE